MTFAQLFGLFDYKEIGVASMVLFAVIDILGSIPIIISLKQKVGEIHPLKATFVATGIMIGFLFIGETILALIGIGTEEFAVAGSFILFFMALEMILGVEIFKESDGVSPKIASVVPLAFPLIAGAGSMTSLVALRAEYDRINIVVAIILNMSLVYLVLKLTKNIEKLLGNGGITILKKVFGIILLAIAVKLFSTNVKLIFN